MLHVDGCNSPAGRCHSLIRVLHRLKTRRALTTDRKHLAGRGLLIYQFMRRTWMPENGKPSTQEGLPYPVSRWRDAHANRGAEH